MKKQIPEAFHPGEYLREELKERGWDERTLRDNADGYVCLQTIKDILNGRTSISGYVATQIGGALGTGGEVWMNLQGVYDLTKKIQEAGKDET